MPEVTPETLIEMRQTEVAEYQRNIDTFTAILQTLSPTLPEHLEPYRNRTDKHVAIAEIANLDDVATLSDVWHYAELSARIRTELLEQRKSQAILTYLEANQ
jgi:DNA integrity scanning protein DisA with diadenylate cyclase activity